MCTATFVVLVMWCCLPFDVLLSGKYRNGERELIRFLGHFMECDVCSCTWSSYQISEGVLRGILLWCAQRRSFQLRPNHQDWQKVVVRSVEHWFETSHSHLFVRLGYYVASL